MKDRLDLFAVYLGLFKKSTCKKVFKESVSPDLMSSLLVTLRVHCAPGVVATVLEGISLTAGFDMTLKVRGIEQ